MSPRAARARRRALSPCVARDEGTEVVACSEPCAISNIIRLMTTTETTPPTTEEAASATPEEGKVPAEAPEAPAAEAEAPATPAPEAETPAPEAEAPAAEADTPAPAAPSNGDLLIEVDGKLVPNYEAVMRTVKEGEVVNGSVVRIDKDEVLVDIGYKAEGVIPSNELSIRKSVDPSEEVELGEEIDALVLTKEDSEGRLILSKKRARFEKAWRKIEVAADSGEPVEGSVIEVVKGGLILDLGVRGFLPASLVDIRRVHNLDEFKGQTLQRKVTELNRSRNNVVLSRRSVLEEERKEVREQILGRLQPGM